MEVLCFIFDLFLSADPCGLISKTLTPDEKKVLDVLAAHDGKYLQKYIRNDWLKIEVTNVTGNEVTLLSTGQFKNGTAIPGNGTIEVWNIQTGTESGTPKTEGPIIAANLNQGDAIPPLNTYLVNKTEELTYLGVSRSVNILNVTISTPDYNSTLTYGYDRLSGMLLEATSETTQAQPENVTSAYSYSVIETNIFGSIAPTPSPTVPEFPSQMISFALLAILIVAISTIVFLKKKTNKNRRTGKELGCSQS